MAIPKEKRADYLTAVGGAHNLAVLFESVLGMEYYATHKIIKNWARGEEISFDIALQIEMTLEARLPFHDRAHLVGAEADNFDLVWPEFGARLATGQIKGNPHMLKIEGPNGKDLYAYTNRAVEVAVMLINTTAQTHPEQVKALLARCPEVAREVREKASDDTVRLTEVVKLLEDQLSSAKQAVQNHAVLLTLLPQT